MKRGSFQRQVAGLVVGTVMAAFAILLAPAPGAGAATVIVVSTTTGGCGNYLSSPTSSISAGVGLLPAAGGTVVVCPGDYAGFNLSFIPGKVTIKAAMAGAANMPRIVPPMGAGGGSVIEIHDSPSMTLDGLHIDGTDFAGPLTNLAIGIAYGNSSGTVQNSTITNVFNDGNFGSGPYNGYGIVVTDNDSNGKVSTVTIKNNTFNMIDHTMIWATGPVKVTTSGNYMLAAELPTYIGAAGVRYEYGAAGAITGNMISQEVIGIALYGVSKISVSKNTIASADTGIDVLADCISGFTQANSNTISGNMLLKVKNGVDIYSDNTSGCDLPHTDFNAVSKNTIGGTGTGIGIRVYDYNTSYAEKNKITGNTIFTFFSENYLGTTDNTIYSGNKYLP